MALLFLPSSNILKRDISGYVHMTTIAAPTTGYPSIPFTVHA